MKRQALVIGINEYWNLEKLASLTSYRIEPGPCYAIFGKNSIS